MSALDHCPPATLKQGQEAFGFLVERIVPIPDVRATAYETRHRRTGAHLLHLHCDDRENLYAITFRTPPPDSCGVAHILEHSVLAGSQNYPLKDVFNELVRGSLNTFINAFTAPDFTCYPVCSQVRADFYNLASVYTDLVLRPLITKSTFMREGHHLEVGEDGQLAIRGIVYNEMKGAFSTPERVSQSATLQGLFPDTPYGVESGGLPERIPDLTYGDFRAFHRQFYSPSNARFFLYGHLPTRGHLEFVARQLEGFDATEVASTVPKAQRWTAPREVHQYFPTGPDDPEQRRTTVNIAWLTASAADLEERLILEVLEEALVGNPAAVLRKALIDSGLGEDLSPSTGLVTWYKELPFVVGLRGTDPQKAGQIERLTLDTLDRIARGGISSDLLEAAFHQVEFKGLEITRSQMPFSIVLLFRCLSSWLHGSDPLPPLTFPTLMSTLRARWTADADLFRKAVGRWLVENPHRLRSVTAPSRTLAGEKEKELSVRLAEKKAAMTEAQLQEIRSSAQALAAEQQEKDSPEQLARLPRLRIDDIPRDVETIPTEEGLVGGARVLEHDLFSNAIAYLDVAFDISDIPEKLQPYLPLLGAAATGMGAAGMGYEALATRRALVTGGVAAQLEAGQRLAGEGTLQQFVLRARALRRNVPAMVAVVRDILVSGDLDDRTRLKDILSEERNQLRATVAPQGHRFSWRSAAAGLSLSAWRDEQWHGASQIRFLGEIADAFDARFDRIRENLAELRQRVFRRDRVIINLTADGDCLAALRDPVRQLITALPEGGKPEAPSAAQLSRVNVGVAIPGDVCYVSRVIPSPRYNDPAAPALFVLAAHLATALLYKKIRVEGGAYGGFSVYAPLSGQLAMLSYRDPHLERTLEVYDSAIDWFIQEGLGPDELRTTIIGAVGKLDRPMDPAEKGWQAMRRILLGLTDNDRQRFRRGLLATDAAAMRGCATDILRAALPSAPQAVYAPRERIEKVNAEISTPFEIATIE